MNIKKSEFDSALVLLGKAVSLGETNNDSVGKLFGAVSEIKDEFRKLPCDVNGKRLEDLEKWQDGCANESGKKAIEKYKGSISLKNAFIIALVTAAISVGITLFTSWIAIGTP